MSVGIFASICEDLWGFCGDLDFFGGRFSQFLGNFGHNSGSNSGSHLGTLSGAHSAQTVDFTLVLRMYYARGLGSAIGLQTKTYVFALDLSRTVVLQLKVLVQ